MRSRGGEKKEEKKRKKLTLRPLRAFLSLPGGVSFPCAPSLSFSGSSTVLACRLGVHAGANRVGERLWENGKRKEEESISSSSAQDDLDVLVLAPLPLVFQDGARFVLPALVALERQSGRSLGAPACKVRRERGGGKRALKEDYIKFARCFFSLGVICSLSLLRLLFPLPLSLSVCSSILPPLEHETERRARYRARGRRAEREKEKKKTNAKRTREKRRRRPAGDDR